MLNQIDFGIKNLGLACVFLSGLSILYYYIQFALHARRIRKIGGVRAPRLAYTPIGGTILICPASWAVSLQSSR